ncbi:Uncharacterised protein [Klebsiella pneumoniae]|uniref:Uncharacterized protein n=1 Tax=Klebsiella pneumoniae TaxID=573 RepID=A0A377W3T4_KLEPN|nr:Uncharacterised protein [Klebsiella pneumoniae]STV22437.1 Uncharacterised protein [Klebsiella pneumoniae]
MRKALGQMQFEVRESAGFETTAEAIDGRFANPGLKGEGGDARMNGLLGVARITSATLRSDLLRCSSRDWIFSSMFISNRALINGNDFING